MTLGQNFGELSLILGENRKATVRALTNSQIIEINPIYLKEILLTHENNEESINDSTLKVNKLTREFSNELDKDSDYKLSITLEKLKDLVANESNIIKALALQLHSRLAQIISSS